MTMTQFAQALRPNIIRASYAYRPPPPMPVVKPARPAAFAQALRPNILRAANVYRPPLPRPVPSPHVVRPATHQSAAMPGVANRPQPGMASFIRRLDPVIKDRVVDTLLPPAPSMPTIIVRGGRRAPPPPPPPAMSSFAASVRRAVLAVTARLAPPPAQAHRPPPVPPTRPSHRGSQATPRNSAAALRRTSPPPYPARAARPAAGTGLRPYPIPPPRFQTLAGAGASPVVPAPAGGGGADPWRFQKVVEEEDRLQKIIDQEVVSEAGAEAVDPISLAHDAAVVDVVNWAMIATEYLDTRTGKSIGTKQANLEAARAKVTELREASTRNSRSLILRDAERYLWARAGIGQFGVSETLNRFLAPGTSDFYDLGKWVDLTFGTNFARSRPHLPYSPRGGDSWFALGLRHWDLYDKPTLRAVGRPHLLAREEVIKRADEAARVSGARNWLNSLQGRGAFVPSP